MSKRNYGDIKSILHFDFPYFNEPNDGLTDEASQETWTKAGNTSLAGTQIPYSSNAAPKFGYRCAYFKDSSGYITGTNNNETFNISKSNNYEIEAFVKLKSYQAGNILNFEGENLPVQWANFNGHTFAYFGNDYWKSWPEAKLFCENLGGHLVTITSAEEEAFIYNFMSDNDIKYLWLGGTYDKQENTWKWTSGEEWNYSNWDDPEYANNPDDNYYSALFTSGTGYIWTLDYEDNNIICEWDKEIEPINFTNLLFAVQSDGTLALSGICDEVTSSTPLTLDTWQHVLLRFSQGYCTLYLDGVQVLGAEMSGDVLTSEVQLGGYVGYMDEFVFRASAGSGTPKIPAAPYNATCDVGLVGGFGTGSDGDVTISANSQINSYGLINSITDNKTFTVNSWSDGTIHKFYQNIFNGHTFEYFSSSKTWADAKAYCESLGGHLATSTSAEKNDFLYNLSGGRSIWLGATDENSEGNWEWITGETWDYTNWYSGQPDNSSDSEHYLRIKSTGTWDDANATLTSVFICEWDYIIDDIPGTELMLHITAPISTTSSYYSKVGLYAFSKIASIDGTNIVLEDEITTLNGFDFTLDSSLLSTYYIQVITVPHFNTLTVNSGKTISPRTWDTTKGGGIVAFRCKGDCTINGSIITHGKGAVRYDWCQMENSKLIDRFLCAQGGGIFITCGGTFTTSENARLGATWSGEGDGSNGAAGKGGNSGYASTNYTTSASSGGVGGGGGGGTRINASTAQGGNVGENGVNGSFCSGGGGCGGNGGSITTTSSYPAGSGGGGQGNSGGKAGTGNYPGNAGTINGGNYGNNNNRYGGAGGGAPGGNGGSGYYYNTSNYLGGLSAGIAGACIILLCKILSVSSASISTGGGTGQVYTDNYAKYAGHAGGGGTGFCYICAERLR